MTGFLKKIILAGLSVAAIFFFAAPIILLTAAPAQAAETRVEVNFFFSQTCPFCAKEKLFWQDLAKKYPTLKVNQKDVAESDNIRLLEKLYQQYDVAPDLRGLVPVSFFEKKAFIGFQESTPKEIEDYLQVLLSGQDEPPTPPVENQHDLSKFKIPFINKTVDLTKMSPLGLTAIVGLLDGFNVCSMLTLGFLLTVLVGTANRKKIFLVGGTFILVSGIVYFLFMTAWLNLFMFLGYYRWLTIIVGILILFFALTLIKEYFKDVICKICDAENEKPSLLTRIQRALFTQLAKITAAEMPIFMMLAIVVMVAAGVNTVELFCSLGFPLAYTKLLTDFNLSPWAYYGYLLVYIFFYLLINILIFVIAMMTMKVVKIPEKYLKSVKLVSGLAMLALGLILLLKPGLLSL